MVMLVGDAARFAIEFDFDHNQDESEKVRLAFGHFRFILNGSTVGDPEEYTSLGTIAASLRSAVDDRPARCAIKGFCEASAAAVFAEFDWVVFGVGRDDESFLVADPRERTFCVSFVHPMTDALGHHKMVLIECGEVQRLIWQDLAGEVRETVLDAGEFEEVASQFIEALDRLIHERPAVSWTRS